MIIYLVMEESQYGYERPVKAFVDRNKAEEIAKVLCERYYGASVVEIELEG